MRGLQLFLIFILLFSQAGLERERKAEYAHQAKAVLSFLDKEFRDPEGEGFLSNPYGNPIKLCHEQALIAIAHFNLYNTTRDKKHLHRAEAIMEYLSTFNASSGGCYRVAGDPGPFHIQEQSITMTAYIQAYRNTGKEEYRVSYRRLADFIISNLCEPGGEFKKVRSWWEEENRTWAEGSTCSDYFEPAMALFQAYAVDGNQTYIKAAKGILEGSNKFWDESNYGYSRGKDDDFRYCRDHTIAALAYISAYDVTNRKDYIQRATDILFLMVSRMGDKVSRTFFEAVSRDGEIQEPRRRKTLDHLLLVYAYLYAYRVTHEDKYLNQGKSLVDSVMNHAYDKSAGAFTDQIEGGVMGDLEVQAYGAISLVEAYRMLTVGPSPLIVIFVIAVLAGLMGLVGYLFKKSWPY